MSVYTCFDMARDCRADLPVSWSYLITAYIPVLRVLLDHYYPARASYRELIERVLRKLRDPKLPLYEQVTTEREWVARLRQELLRLVEIDKASGEADIPLDLEILTTALEPFTVVERQMVWFETVRYTPEQTAHMMNLDASSIDKARARAEEALRGQLDRWHRGLLAENGLALGQLAEAARGESCLPPKAYLDTLDGRITWQRKKDYDFHMMQCWHCIDASCRIREVDHVLRFSKSLTAEQAKPFRDLLGLPEEKKSLLKGLFAR